MPDQGSGKALTASGEIDLNTFTANVGILGANQTVCAQIQNKELIESVPEQDANVIPIQSLKLSLFGIKSIS